MWRRLLKTLTFGGDRYIPFKSVAVEVNFQGSLLTIVSIQSHRSFTQTWAKHSAIYIERSLPFAQKNEGADGSEMLTRTARNAFNATCMSSINETGCGLLRGSYE
jgi:hypothetical protein